MICYISKQLGRTMQEALPPFWAKSGKWWGVWGKLPIDPLHHRLTHAAAVKVWRVTRKYLRRQRVRRVARGMSAITCFLPSHDAERLVHWARAEAVAERGRPRRRSQKNPLAA